MGRVQMTRQYGRECVSAVITIVTHPLLPLPSLLQEHQKMGDRCSQSFAALLLF